MAEYRQLKEAFWYSPFVLNLSPEERAFYVFMITNPATSQCGIYEISLKMIVTLHGYNEEFILDLIQKFVTWKKLAYDPDTHEFFVVNWMKHHRPSNQKVFGKVGKEVRATKSKTLKDLWGVRNPLDAEKIGQPFTIATVGQPLGNGINTVSQPLSNGMDTVQNLENVEKNEFQKEINSSVPGYSSLDLQKEVGCSLPGLKAEEAEPKDQQHHEYQQRDLYNNELSCKENQVQEEQENQPGEEIIPHLADLNLKKPNSQNQTGNQEPKKNAKQEPEPKQPGKTPHPGSADPPPEELLANEPPADEETPSPEELVIAYFNQQMCTGYRLGSGKTRDLIHRKLQEGFSVADFHTVIDKKIHDWQEPKYRSNLVPHVLFGDKFEAYLQQTPQVNVTYRGFGSRIPVSTFHNQTRDIVEVF